MWRWCLVLDPSGAPSVTEWCHRMSNGYYIRLRGAVTGPYDQDHLQRLASRGQFSRFHEVSLDGLNWDNASSTLPSVFGHSAAIAETSRPTNAETTRSTPIDDNSSTPGEWYVQVDGEPQGPFSKQQVESFIRAGQVSEPDLVWSKGMDQWAPAQEALPELVLGGSHSGGVKVKAVSQEDQETSLIAVASVAFAALWLFGIGSLMAVVLGGLALHQIETSEGHVTGRKWAMLGLALGLVGALATTVAFCLYRAGE